MRVARTGGVEEKLRLRGAGEGFDFMIDERGVRIDGANSRRKIGRVIVEVG